MISASRIPIRRRRPDTVEVDLDPTEVSADPLDDLIGNRVEVRSVGESDAIDEGVVEGYLHPWLRLRNARGELLYIPIYRIRLIKLLKQLRPAEPAKSLMRPASAPTDGEKTEGQKQIPTG